MAAVEPRDARGGREVPPVVGAGYSIGQLGMTLGRIHSEVLRP